jgi:4a-hydroxytetrahydrobiopterin dehydratase
MSTLNDEILRDALAQLDGWHGDTHGIKRFLEISEAQHAELTERIKVVADAMRLRPELHRADGRTLIALSPAEGDQLTMAQVAMAARIEAAYRAVTGVPSTLLVRPMARPWMRWRRGSHGSVADQAG